MEINDGGWIGNTLERMWEAPYPKDRIYIKQTVGTGMDNS